MNYYAFFISTDDGTIRFKRPGAVNISISPRYFTIVRHKKIPLNRITSLTVEHKVADKELSAGGALGGAILAGGVGMAVGAAMGGKKVSSIITIVYANENSEVCTNLVECSHSFKIKEKFDKYRAANQPKAQSAVQQPTKPQNSPLRRGIHIYFTWPYQLYKTLKRGRTDHAGGR